MFESYENTNSKSSIQAEGGCKTPLVSYFEELSKREDIELGYWLLALPAVQSVQELMALERLLKKALFDSTYPMIATNSISMALGSCFARRLGQLKCDEAGDKFEAEEVIDGILKDPNTFGLKSLLACAFNSISKIDTSLLDLEREED